MGPPLALPQCETLGPINISKDKMTQRTPMARAIATGRTLHDAKRFRGRTEPASTGPLGPPPGWLNRSQRESWETLRSEVPWLQKSHRCITAIASIAQADLRAGGEFNIRMATLLRQCLGQLGATPASRVAMPEQESADPAAKYFG